jgi:hypothetical protein
MTSTAFLALMNKELLALYILSDILGIRNLSSLNDLNNFNDFNSLISSEILLILMVGSALASK